MVIPHAISITIKASADITDIIHPFRFEKSPLQNFHYNLRISVLRRVILIVFLVIIAAAIGGGVGVGVAYYFLTKNLQNVGVESPDTLQSSSNLQDTTVSKVISEVKSEIHEGDKPKTVQQRETTGVSKVETQTPDTSSNALIIPENQQSQNTQGQLVVNEQKQPTQTTSIPDIKAPTIDLSSSNLSGNVSLSKPSTPTTKMPDITPTLSGRGLSLNIETLKEEDIRKVYYQQGNISKAEQMVRDALSKNPNDEVAKKYLRIIKLEKTALSLEAQGDTEGAKRVWQQILSIDPSHPRAKAKTQ